MAEYRLVESLPVYAVGTLQTLLEREGGAVGQHARSGSSSVESWLPCEVGDGGQYGYNAKGRILLVTKEKREIVVCTAPPSSISPNEMGGATSDVACRQVFAFDRNCYHVGYPMDLGDMEDIEVCGKNDGSVFHVACINCPLHNRIFDLKTGDLVTVSHFEGSDAAPFVVSQGRRKGGVPTTHGCHQRVHPVILEPIGSSVDNNNNNDTHDGSGERRAGRPQDYRILVRDTFGQSNVLSHGIAEAAAAPTTVVETNVRLQSDKYNLANSHEDFAEYNPKRGNSFVKFRPPEEQTERFDGTAPATAEVESDDSTSSVESEEQHIEHKDCGAPAGGAKAAPVPLGHAKPDSQRCCSIV